MKNVTRYFQHDQTNQPRVSLLIMGKFRHTWPHAFNNFFFWASIYLQKWTILPAGNYMFKVNKRKIQQELFGTKLKTFHVRFAKENSM